MSSPRFCNRLEKYLPSKVNGVGSKGARFESPPVLGQVLWRSLAKSGSMFVALYMRFRKALHRAKPIVWPPERATKSVSLRPCLLKLLINPVRLRNGDGMSLLARVLFAVVESLLPRGTFHVGPPSCKFVKHN